MDKDDDINFEDAMRDVTPLHQDTHKQRSHKRKLAAPKNNQTYTQNKQACYDFDFNLINQDNWVTGEDLLSFHKGGLQKKIITQLRQGKYPYEARLDLHHATASEAMAMVDCFIEQCRDQNIRCALIIHGKGYMSRHEKPILKNILAQHLRLNPFVLAYHSAQPKDGGTGAVYTLIKASHKAT